MNLLGVLGDKFENTDTIIQNNPLIYFGSDLDGPFIGFSSFPNTPYNSFGRIYDQTLQSHLGLPSVQSLFPNAIIRYPPEDPARQTLLSLCRPHPEHIDNPAILFDDPDNRYFLDHILIGHGFIKLAFDDTAIPQTSYEEICRKIYPKEPPAGYGPLGTTLLNPPDIELILPHPRDFEFTFSTLQMTPYSLIEAEKKFLDKLNPQSRCDYNKLAHYYYLPYHISFRPIRRTASKVTVSYSHRPDEFRERHPPAYHNLLPGKTTQEIFSCISNFQLSPFSQKS